jgi:hypothetical protein
MNISKTFIEAISTLLITAIISGLLIPYILKTIDGQNTRQSKIIEAQSKFLDDISQLLWKWRSVNIKVVYYGSTNRKDRYNNAKKEYEEVMWDIMNNLRGEIGRSRRLASEKAYQDLVALYWELVGLAIKVTTLIANEESDENIRQHFAELNQVINSQLTVKIDDMLNFLATELRLKQIT